jgi:energy-coupling factor transporter ATP-binding protein EcfA2
MNRMSPNRHRPADNPFASHRVEALAYRSSEFHVAELCRRLEILRGRAAIVGPKGSGKTTLLEELAAALPGEPVRVRIEASARRPWRSARAQLPKAVMPNQVVLVDGAEKLGPLGWRLLLLATRHAKTFVATLHRPGRLPTLIECRTEPTLLRSLVEELAPTDAPILAPGLENLFDRHRGDIRLCFRELYDVYAGRSSVEF